MSTYDIVFLGGGMSYEAAIHAGRHGLSVAVIEKDRLGGTCLNRGCIPTKTFLKSAIEFSRLDKLGELGIAISEPPTFDLAKVNGRIASVANRLRSGIMASFKKTGVTLIEGTGRITGTGTCVVTSADGAEQSIAGSALVIATGSAVRDLGRICSGTPLSSDDIFSLDRIPSSIGIVGGGVIGIEIASIMNMLGAKVTVFEMLNDILPGFDADIVNVVKSELGKKGIVFRTGVKIGSIDSGTTSGSVTTEGGTPETFEMILSSVGRVPVLPIFENISVALDAKGFIAVDDRLMTSVEGIYAIGDVIGQPMLAHKASYEGKRVVDAIRGLPPAPYVHENIPSVVYSQPQVAKVGFGETEACWRFGDKVIIESHPFISNSKSVIEGERGGFVKLVFASDTLVGASAVGAHVSELIGTMIWPVAMKLNRSQLANIIYPHPTELEIFGVN